MTYKNYVEKGSALLSALFIMTLIAIAATAMTTRLQLDIYRSRLLINSDKLYLASQAVTFWSIAQLKNKKIEFNRADKLGAIAVFPKKLENIYPDMTSKGYLIDLQAKFNVNALGDKKAQAMFHSMLGKILPNKSPSERRQLIMAIANWISAYQPERGADPYLPGYLKNKPAYQPGRQMMRSITELRLVHGVDQKTYQKLLPFVTALPDNKTTININTAPLPVLMALGNGLTQDQAYELIQARGKDGFKKMGKITKLLKKLSIANEQITLESNYYLSKASISYDNLNLRNFSLLKRSKTKDHNKEKIHVSLIVETINSL